MDEKLIEAFIHGMGGGTTFVIGDNHTQAKEAFFALQKLPQFDAVRSFAQCNAHNLEISLWPKGQILFRHRESKDWDPKTTYIRGYPRGLPVVLLTPRNPPASQASSSTKVSPNTSKTSDGSSGERSKP